MKLNKVISLNNWFSKSVNLERDSSTSEALSSYVPTSVSKRMLSSFFESQKKDKRLSRAWSLIGPYGSGKSSFALFLTGLLEDPASDLHKLACKKLQKFDEDLFKQHKRIIKNTNGYFNVLVTGSTEPIEEKLYRAIFESLEHSEIAGQDKKKILKTKIIEKKITSSNVVNLVKEIQFLLKSSTNDYSGFVLIIDELGKFVEFAGRNRIEGDIYLLQQLAELSFQDNAVPFSLVVMLHQAIEYYAKDLDQKTKNEWRKIQGRFEEVSFSETVEQSVLIIKEAIQGEYSQSQKNKLKTLTRKALKPLLKQQAVPGNLDLSEAEELFTECYPLHPVTAIILPMLSQKLAQNERTLFSFLSSSQDFGFPSFLEQKNFEEYITTSDLFDYFIANQGSYISDHYTHRRWLEVQNALDRLGEAPSTQVNLIKTIGLLNIVGSMGGFKASLDLLSVIFEEKQLSKDIKVLEKKSLVSFRRFNDEYRIWQGSDFNLEQGLSHEMAQFEDFSLAKELNHLIPPRPQIAKKSSITNHTLRYFRTSYLNESDLIAYQEEDSYPKIIYLLRDNNLKANEFKDLVSRLSKNIILVSIDSSSGLENMCKELSAMKVILLSYPEIQSDPIAKKEVEDQILNLEEQISNRLNSALRDKTSTWYHQGKFVNYKSTIDLQNKFSDIIDEIYPDSPIIANELLNRDVISGQAQRARTMLIQAMIEENLLKELAFDNSKYPPEKTICEALLIKHNLVTFSSDGNLKFNSPDKQNDFFPLFEMLKSTLRKSKSPISFKEIQKKMSRPPFGIKEGLHPVIFMSFFMVNRNKLAIYEDNQFKPYMDSEAIDRFVRTKTNSFAFQLYEFKGQAKLIDEYVKGSKVNGIIADHWKSLEHLKTNKKKYCLIHGKEINHTKGSGINKRIIKVLDNVEKVIANSEYTKNLAIELGVNPEKIVVINPGIDPVKNIDQNSLDKVESLLAVKTPKLITVSRFDKRKNHEKIIMALRNLKQIYPDIVYICIGYGEEEDNIKNLVKELDLESQVMFFKDISDNLKNALVAKSNIFVMPSVIHKSSVEGFGIAYTEAAQYSIPSIGGKDGGASDAIDHEKTGLICDGNNLDEIYSSINSMLENKKYLEYGKNAKEYVSKFYWSNIIEEYKKILN